MSIQAQVWGFLKGKGLPEKSIAAVMGNIEAESGFNINLIEKGSGIGFGLCQWSFGRRKQLERYGTSLDHQLNFMWAELSGTGLAQVGANFQWIEKSGYLRHPAFMAGNGTINQLTSAMCFCWERPNKALAHLDRRHKAAQRYYNQFTGSTGEYTPNVAGNQMPTMEIEETNYQVVRGSEKTGDYLFGRKYRITVSDAKGKGIDVSELHCKFSILKTMQMEPNFSEITIYNLNAKTENNIRMNGTRVTVEAGYEGHHFGLIFDGDIIQCIQEKENANTYKLIIVALDSDRAINMDVTSFSVLRGQSHREIVNTIVNTAKYPIKIGSISDKLKGTKLTRGRVFFGKSSDYLNQIAKSNGLKFYMDDGRVNLIDLKEPPKNEIIKLNPESGLIGVPDQSEYGVSGTSLLNPQIKLNSLIHIDNTLIRDKRINLGTNNTIPALGDNNNNSSQSTGGQLSGRGYSIPYNGSFKITSHFGPRWGRNHNGIDIGMPVGTPIYASKAGKVLKAGVDSGGVDSGGGKVVRLTHPDGTATNYYHFSAWKVKTGDQVRQGQLIGLSGNTGASTGPHLHFEIKENGKFIDPLFVIQGGKGQSPPSSTNIEEPIAEETAQYLMRALDKDGIYRVIKLEYLGDTRGNDWYVNFETITQIGGTIPIVPM